MRILLTLLKPTVGQARVAGFDVMTHPKQVRAESAGSDHHRRGTAVALLVFDTCCVAA